MHVAIVGAGALGLAYGVWTAAAPEGGAEVSFVVRREEPRGAVRVERVGRTAELAREVRRVASVRASTQVAAEADVVVVTVRADQLASALGTIAAGPSDAPVVVLTPMMPAAYAGARALLGSRLRAAMPGVIAYVAGTDDETGEVRVRAWFPAAAPTFLDEQRGTADQLTTLAALAETWTAAGLATRFAMGVHETNPATTAAFIPLTMAVDVAGSLGALVADAALLDLAVRAADEGLALGSRLGQVAPWAALMTRLARPSLIKLGVALARRSAPEACGYVDGHFGRKLHTQNVAMATELVELVKQRGEAHAALDELRMRLVSIS